MEVQNLFEIGTIITYGSGISACEKSLEWQRSLQLLKELPEKSLEGILGKNTPFLFVSAQWLGNILGTNFCPQIWTLEMDLGWFVHDFSIKFKDTKCRTVLCSTWGENLIRITTLVDLDNATVAGVCKTFVNYLYNVTFFLEQTFHSRIFVFELEQCRFAVLQSTTISFLPDKFYESLIWIVFCCTSIWSIDVWNTTLSQTQMFPNAHICIYYM